MRFNKRIFSLMCFLLFSYSCVWLNKSKYDDVNLDIRKIDISALNPYFEEIKTLTTIIYNHKSLW